MSGDSTMSTRSTLLIRLRAGEDLAYRELLEWAGPQVLRWCKRLGLSDNDAEDIFQESFLAVFRYLGSFEKRPHEGGFRAWLWRIVSRKAVDLHRRRDASLLGSADDTLVCRMPPKEDQPERNDLLWVVCRMVRTQFTETSWQVFWLTTVEDRSAIDVANELGMTAEAVRKAKSRVLSALRAELEAWGGSR